MFLEDPTFRALTGTLQAAALRQKVIAHNVANVNTPGYHRQVVNFATELATARELPVSRTDLRHLAGPIRENGPQISLDATGSLRPDGGNVDLQREMLDLTRNALEYNFTAQLLNTRLGQLRHVISEGRR